MATIPIDEIEKSIKSIKFGQVQITIHNSDVVQIEQIERIRFDIKNSNSKVDIQSQTKHKSK
jgi:hypothetical protein